ncbi:MAG: Malonyl CoA-acyl carrier protein transacylase [Pelotomaculum sp. PtaU1.Bin035]|nr:MAG: Malonyl CoA-acyl carrier protein transacylase [Pelotomaculum sp. PtaU1.Bin035]
MSIAFFFPGQGSQYVGMAREFYENFSEARDVFSKADEALRFSISGMCFSGPEEDLNKTINTQPAVLTASVACLEVLRRAGGPVPFAVAGHSLGEYTALVAAGSLLFEDAVQLVRKRGQYMQEAVPLGAGGMAAVVGLSGEAVREVCRKASAAGIVEAVNLNCPGQVVVAGDNEGLKAAGLLAKEAGAKRFIPLPVSAPFHSSLMRPAGEKLAKDLDKISIADPAISVVANVNADFVRTGQEVMNSLVRQVYSPVRWEESVRLLISSGVTIIIEVGPGKVLSGLVKKISRETVVCNIEDGASLEKVLALIREVS